MLDLQWKTLTLIVVGHKFHLFGTNFEHLRITSRTFTEGRPMSSTSMSRICSLKLQILSSRYRVESHIFCMYISYVVALKLKLWTKQSIVCMLWRGLYSVTQNPPQRLMPLSILEWNTSTWLKSYNGIRIQALRATPDTGIASCSIWHVPGQSKLSLDGGSFSRVVTHKSRSCEHVRWYAQRECEEGLRCLLIFEWLAQVVQDM